MSSHVGGMMETPLNITESEEFKFFPFAAFEGRRKHAWNKIKWHIPDEAKIGRFLDIGCGTGNAVIAALQHGFTTAVGLDRDFGEFGWFNINQFDKLCGYYEVDPAKAVMVAADLFSSSFAPQAFTAVLMLDSIEHVPDPAAFIASAAKYVAPDGYLVIDTCPLFYSRNGHHLFNHIPHDDYPWAHLRHDFYDLVERFKVDDWSMERYDELNKVTHDEILKFVRGQGLEIISEIRGKKDNELSALLEKHRSNLDLDGIDENWLFENWICIVARRM